MIINFTEKQQKLSNNSPETTWKATAFFREIRSRKGIKFILRIFFGGFFILQLPTFLSKTNSPNTKKRDPMIMLSNENEAGDVFLKKKPQ